MAIEDLKARIGRLPEQPGVYQFSSQAGETLYVGKARVLRDRVRSYLSARGSSPRIDALLDEADQLEVIVTDSVVEALALENHLIKQRAPRFNVLLRDDKNYPYLQLTTAESFPRVLVARRVERDGHVYAGPFLPASLARRTMSLAHRLFGIRSCNEVITGRRDRPCLEYDIKRCIAPCVESLCSAEEYGRAVANTRLFLEGRNDELVDQLSVQMADAAAAERFEQAAQLRDAVRTLETLRHRQQKMVNARLGDRDAFGVKVGPAGVVIQIFQMRRGRVIERVELMAEASAVGGDREEDVLQAALQQHYELRQAPPEIHVPVDLEEREALERWLAARAGRRVRIIIPKRGERRELLALASRNAAVTYQSHFSDDHRTFVEALDTLRMTLGLRAIPQRIECFDISTIQGRETVASMVVCEDGRMKRGEYRKYRMREQGLGPDDFAAMREVVERRYRRALEGGGPFPDLVLIDGGRGHIGAAYEALEKLGLGNLVAVGIAKKEELLYMRDRAEPIALRQDSPGLLLLRRVRDEAHRVALSFHRKARAMRDLQSELDRVPGIGPRRRRALLTTFGSVAGVRRATREQLVVSVGARRADALLDYFAAPRA